MGNPTTDLEGQYSPDRNTVAVSNGLFEAALAAAQGGPPLTTEQWAQALRVTTRALCEAGDEVKRLRERVALLERENALIAQRHLERFGISTTDDVPCSTTTEGKS